MLLYRWFIKALKGLVVWMPDFLMFSQALTKGKHLWSLQHLKIFDEIFLFHFYLLIFGIESFTLFENAEELWQNKGLRRIVVVTVVVFFPSLGNRKLFYKKPFPKNGIYDIWRTKLTRQMTRAVVRILKTTWHIYRRKMEKTLRNKSMKFLRNSSRDVCQNLRDI